MRIGLFLVRSVSSFALADRLRGHFLVVHAFLELLDFELDDFLEEEDGAGLDLLLLELDDLLLLRVKVLP